MDQSVAIELWALGTGLGRLAATNPGFFRWSCAATTNVRVMASDAAGTNRPGGHVTRFALRHWLVIVLVVLAAIFVAQNRDRHPIHVLWVTVESPTWFVLAVIFAVGLVIGLLLRRRRR